MKTTQFSSSSSSPSDRRIGALLRHLTSGNESQIADRLSSVYASPTSGATGGSVFAHLVQAPEDPILGVNLLLLLRYVCVVYSFQIYCTTLLDMCMYAFDF